MSEINRYSFSYPAIYQMGSKMKPLWWTSTHSISVGVVFAFVSLKVIWTLSNWALRNLYENLIPRVVVYGATHDKVKIVRVFSRYVSKSNLNAIAKKLIHDPKAFLKVVNSWDAIDENLFSTILNNPSLLIPLLESEEFQQIPEKQFRQACRTRKAGTHI